MPTLRFSWSWSWQFISTIVIVGAGVALLFFSQLESLLPGYSNTEVAMAESSISLQAIAENPINAPYKLLVYGVTLFNVDALLATRIASAIFGTATLLLFYVGVRHWHTSRVAFLSAVLFACSAWLLHTARFGSGDIMLPFIILLFATCGYWVAASAKRSGWRYIIAVVALSFSIYVPGVIWLVLLGLLIRRGKDLDFIRRRLPVNQKVLLTALLLLLTVAPLIYGIIRTPALGLELLALPTVMPDALEVLKNLALLPINLIIWSDFSPELWLGNLPLLDVFAAAMFFLGIYHCIKNWQLDRSKLLLGLLGVGSVLVALGGISMALLLPAVYVVIAGGIAALLGMWLGVFPRNPLARSLGIVLVTAAVAASVVFNIRVYFVAWPHNAETKAVYTEKSVTIDD